MQYLWAAFFLDFLFGDPPWFPHPIRFIGNLIKALEKTIRPCCKTDRQRLVGGGILVLLCVTVVTFLTWCALEMAKALHPWAFIVLNIILMYFAIAANCLKFEGRRIQKYLEAGDLENGRKYLGYIVGRDVENLEAPDIIRGTVETIGENTSDGVIAPLFYMAIGGAPLAMAYKAINTMDSMLGYKNEKYLYFGRIAAKLDDVANYIPARITGILIGISAFVLRYDWKSSFRILKRDSRNHTSPNSGFPESAVAGALGVRLGGVNSYFGIPSEKPFIGDEKKGFEPKDIQRSSALMYGASVILLGLLTVIEIILRKM